MNVYCMIHFNEKKGRGSEIDTCDLREACKESYNSGKNDSFTKLKFIINLFATEKKLKIGGQFFNL